MCLEIHADCIVPVIPKLGGSRKAGQLNKSFTSKDPLMWLTALYNCLLTTYCMCITHLRAYIVCVRSFCWTLHSALWLWSLWESRWSISSSVGLLSFPTSRSGCKHFPQRCRRLHVCLLGQHCPEIWWRCIPGLGCLGWKRWPAGNWPVLVQQRYVIGASLLNQSHRCSSFCHSKIAYSNAILFSLCHCQRMYLMISVFLPQMLMPFQVPFQ